MSVKTIAIVHHVHTDFGYTDHQSICRINQKEYISKAIRYILDTENYPQGSRFCWTQEQLDSLKEWWESATSKDKELFFAALSTGRLEICGAPFNVTAFLSRAEWEAIMNWIPDKLWAKFNIKTAMQIDVNGLHTRGAEYFYDKGLKNLWMGPNPYFAKPPMPVPKAFNWQIADGKKMFVWLNASYNNGHLIFHEDYWRQGPIPASSDLRYRAPEAGDIWSCDEESILKAHKLCLKNLAILEGKTTPCKTDDDGFTKNQIFGGYTLETLPVSVTNQWRIDNDPPFLPISDFVRKWNEMKLEPKLVLCTATEAMNMVRNELGDNIETLSGEWIDWWANGNASCPAELSISRQAKQTLKSAHSELFGKLTPEQKKYSKSIMENICIYGEHSFGSWESIQNPYSFNTKAQSAEKNILAYRALDGARYLLSQRVRPLIKDIKNEIVVWNTSDVEITSEIRLPQNCMRGEYHSVLCKETGKNYSIDFEDTEIAFGNINIPAKSCLHFVPQKEKYSQSEIHNTNPEIKTDRNGWPLTVHFACDTLPVVCQTFGELLSVKAKKESSRRIFTDIFEKEDPKEREALRQKHLEEIKADYGKAVCTKKRGCIIYEQSITHPSLNHGKRILKIDPAKSTVSLQLNIDRRLDFSPEVLFLHFKAPQNCDLPYISNIERPFRPVADQLPGSCMDFYAFDGWINYPCGWMLNCRDNALVSFGNTGVVSRKTELSGSPDNIYVRLFDNIWDTNFAAGANGTLTFNFTASNNILLKDAVKIADSMNTEPVVAVKMGYKS